MEESNKLRRVGSSSNFFTSTSSIPFTNIYAQLWRCLMNLTRDPFHDVSNMAKIIVGRIRKKIFDKVHTSPANHTIPRVCKLGPHQSNDTQSTPGSPRLSPNIKPRHVMPSPPQSNLPHSVQYPTRRAYGDATLDTVNNTAKTGSQELPGEGCDNTESKTTSSDNVLDQVNTDLFSWCARYFVQCQLRPQEDKESALYMARIERLRNQNSLNKANKKEWCNTSELTSFFPQQVFIQRNSHCPLLLRFHPHYNELLVADKSGVSVWDWSTGNQLQYLVSRAPAGVELLTNPPPTPLIDSLESRVSALELINSEEESGLVMTGSDDGAIRIWRNYSKYMGQDPEMVTAWIALTDMLQSNRTAGLVTHWSQSSGQLAVSGDVKIVRLWDSTQEARIVDIATMADSCVTCLERSRDDRLMFAGFGDGTVRMFDVRSSSPCVITGGQGDSGWIHSVKLNYSNDSLYTVGHSGTISTWNISYMSNMSGKDLGAKRRETLVGRPNGTRSFSKVNQVIPSFRQRSSVYCADLKVDIGTARHGLAVMGVGTSESREVSLIRAQSAQVLSTLKFYDGFSRENIGVPSCVTFHPTMPLVAMGFNDSMLLMLNFKSK